MRIESGPAPDKLRRAGIRTVILLAVGVWFAYDGWVGYPKQNRQEYSEQFAERPNPASLAIHPEITEEFTKQLDARNTLSDAEKRLGPPAMKTDLDARWFGPAGTLIVPVRGGAATFKSAKHTATDMLVQRAIAIGLLLAFVVSAAAMLRLRSTRYALDDSGLTLPKVGSIGWDAMQKLNGDRVEEVGWVELHYADGGGGKSVRIDSFEIAAFGEIVDAICERKGFENPLPVRTK